MQASSSANEIIFDGTREAANCLINCFINQFVINYSIFGQKRLHKYILMYVIGDRTNVISDPSQKWGKQIEKIA